MDGLVATQLKRATGMRTSCLIVVVVVLAWTVGVAGAQEGLRKAAEEPRSPPRVAKAKYSAEKKTLEVQSLVPESVTQSYVVRLPVTTQRVADGRVVVETQFRDETRQRIVTKWTPMVKEYPLDQIEVRTVKGLKAVPSELPRLFAGELRPVVLVERIVRHGEGKPVMTVEDVDPAFLQLLKENTLIVLLPPVPELPPSPILPP